MVEAKQGASRLLGCYRTGDANDPETYISAVVSVLVRYSPQIVHDVTEPATGLPSKLKWLPTIAEIREECEMLAGRERRKIERDEQIKSQLEARLLITDQRERPSYEELAQRCADAGFPIGPKKLNPMDARSVCAKHGISQADWDSIPERA